MSFVSTFNALPLSELHRFSLNATIDDVESAKRGLAGFAALISLAAARRECLEQLAQRSQETTLRHFGRTVRMYAPLYLSNECINICKYCGFSRDNPILRVTLTPEQVEAEARYLHQQGFRHLLLVAGEHPHFVSGHYLRECVARLRPKWSSLSLEVGPMEEADYRRVVEAGAEGLVVYQETYDRQVYATMHAGGPKTDFDWRLETAERAYEAGFKRLGVGALLGLADWRYEALAVAAHVEYLLRKCWKAQVTVSFPRLRPAAGEFHPLVPVSDKDLVQFICALRLTYPEIGIVLSTRESATLRDGLLPLGVTMMSAGSHTEPGGYTGQGKEDLHLTRGGRRVKPEHAFIQSEGGHATEQFEIADCRSPVAVAGMIAAKGYEPVWKDWEATLNETS